MASRRRFSTGKKILIGILVLVLLSGLAFHLFITRYLPPLVRSRLTDIVVKGSDSLYRLEMGKFDISFWGGSARFMDVRITIDSAKYNKMSLENRLPPLTFNLGLQKASVDGIGLSALIFSKKINIRQINFTSADVNLARHFRTTDTASTEEDPLWKLIQPDIRSISIDRVHCADLKVKYQNIDSAKSFRWQFDKCNIFFSDIRVDSLSALDSTRLLFAKNVALTANEIKMKTPDGLYNLLAENIYYTSAARSLEVKQFDLHPAVSQRDFINHFGYQHELYKLKFPVIRLRNFVLPAWISRNKLQADTAELASPSVSIHMDRNARPATLSKKGKYPHQLLQKAPFTFLIKRLKATDASVVYSETNDVNQLTGKVVFPSLSGVIDNITNDTFALTRSRECIADIRGTLMKTGNIHSIFRFNLADPNGAFAVNGTITNLNAAQLQPVFKAMTSTDLQTFNMKRMDFTINGNEDRATGSLKMKYDEMDILLNRVEGDKSFNKRGLLSFLANRLVIYKENPMKDEEEREARNIVVQRDATRSFFNLVWKIIFTSAGEIVLRPVAQRKIEKRKQRALENKAASKSK